MIRNSEMGRVPTYVLALGVVVAGGYSMAVPAQEAPSEVQTVTVTGSRIRQPQLEAPSPVTIVNAEEFKQAGTTRVEDLLNTMPQVAANYGANVANGATGAATVSLYGLGANRTLVLVNGRRLMPGDPTQNGQEAPDLNQIPSALVQRVDLLTGGASAVYGADAVAGVVNFVMNDHFQGVRLDGNFGFYSHDNHNTSIQTLVSSANFTNPPGSVNDGYSRDFTVILGANFADGRGNAVAYIGYRRVAALTEAQRDFSACSLNWANARQLFCGGSTTSYPGAFRFSGGTYTIGGATGDQATGGLGAAANSGPLYNFGPLNHYQRPDERYTGGVFAHLDLSSHARAYTEFMFMDDNTDAQIAPSGSFQAGLGTTAGIPDASSLVNCDNPLLSAQERATFCRVVRNSAGVQTSPDANNNVHLIIGRRLIEAGPRINDLTHTSYRMVFGVRGDINDAWSYDAFASNGITRYAEEYRNDVSKVRTAFALQAVADPATGQVICKANSGGRNDAPGCVPWNIFKLGGVTPAQAAYLTVPGQQEGSTTERVLDGSVSGDLGKWGIQLPTAHEGIGVSFGAEWREEKSELRPDQEFVDGDLAGQGARTLPTKGDYHVAEGFLEGRIPLMQDKPFADSLIGTVGYRYSSYNLAFGSTSTYKIQLEWAPMRDFRVRGGYNRAVRAPNIQELFRLPRVQLSSGATTDPCAGTNLALLPAFALCARTGVTAAEYGRITANTANQYNVLSGGNTSLSPETADTYTIGVVLTPTFVPNLAVTVDYFNIKINQFINNYGGDLILSTCLNTGAPQFCSLVNRSPATGSPADGSLWIGDQGYTIDPIRNLGNQRVTGVDVTADYNLDVGFLGKLNFSLVGTYGIINATEPFLASGALAGSGSYDCSGYYGPVCGVPAPKWRHKLKTTWRTPVPALDAWLQWRTMGSVAQERTNVSPLLSGPIAPNAVGRKLSGRDYIDLGVAYTLATKYTVRLGVNNLFDKDPPISPSPYIGGVFGNGNTYPQVYDTLGRYLFLNVTANF